MEWVDAEDVGFEHRDLGWEFAGRFASHLFSSFFAPFQFGTTQSDSGGTTIVLHSSFLLLNSLLTLWPSDA